MEKSAKAKVYSILAIMFLIVAVSVGTFAYFGSFVTNLNSNMVVNINAASPGNSSLVTSSAVLNLQVPSTNMSELMANNVVAAAESSAILNVTLTGSTGISTRCTYDIVFEYSSNSNVYGQSPTTKTSGADKEITFEVEGPTGTSNPFGGEANIDYDTSKGWIAKTSTTGAKIKLASGVRITNNSNMPSAQVWKITARYYNLKVSQEQLAGKGFVGKIYAENPVCNGTIPDAEDLIKNIAAEGEKASSQDSSTKYIVSNENGYRYEGKDPDNYICLDNNSSGTCAEDNTFRIIGVFDEKVGTSETDAKLQPVIKIIKSTNYTSSGIAWDTNRKNNWNNSSLKTLLNGTYLTSLNSYNHIDKVLSTRWSLNSLDFSAGKYNGYWPQAQIFNNSEKYGVVYEGNPTYTYAKVGLMYPSDYMYGVMASDCDRSIVSWANDNTVPSYVNTEKCSTQNWLYNKKFDKTFWDNVSGSDYSAGLEWTLSPFSDDDGDAFFVRSDGGVDGDDVDILGSVRPLLNLDTSIELIGSGSLSNPYRIK